MNDDNYLKFTPSVFLRNGIRVEDIGKGVLTFETDTELLEPEVFDEESFDDAPDNLQHKYFKGWEEEPYDRLWSQMAKIDEYTRKSVVVKGSGPTLKDHTSLRIHLCIICEGASNPITCTCHTKPMNLHLDDCGHLKSLDVALKTMKIGESSRFLMSYKVMYGELGCPPLIPPRANCLITLSVLSFLPALEDRSDLEDMGENFKLIYEKAAALHITGKMFFQKREYSHAVKSFKSAVNYMEFCRMKDEKEEEKQQKFLGKLYLNLAITYNKLKLPLKACSMCNELKYMGILWNNSKALLHNSRALAMIGDYEWADKKLRAALRVDPDCSLIREELTNLQEKKAISNQHKENLMRNIKCTFRISGEKNIETKFPSEDFDDAVKKFCDSAFDDSTIKVTLPSGLSEAESVIIKQYADANNLFCEMKDNIVTHISKMDIHDFYE